MNILDIIDLSRCNKILAILTPNYIEAKLLFDRFLLSKIDGLSILNSNTLSINGSRLIFITPDTAQNINATHYVVEFYDSIPERILFDIQCNTAEFTFAPWEIT